MQQNKPKRTRTSKRIILDVSKVEFEAITNKAKQMAISRNVIIRLAIRQLCNLP